ncbi:MAG: helix-turn-helix domain-containing protein [Acidiferrobacterales bacterium]
MFSFTDEETNTLSRLGDRLRLRRIAKRDDQVSLAARIGVSVPTYRKMERGEGSVPVGYWIRALRLLDSLDLIDTLLPVSLLPETPRQRVSRSPRARTSR